MADYQTDRDIRAMLRGAVVAKVIDGWYWYGFPPDLRWVVNAGGSTTVYQRSGVVLYCEMLQEVGVEPTYRLGDRYGPERLADGPGGS